MKKLALGSAALLLVLVVAPAQACAQATAGPALDYHVSFTEDDHPKVEVRVSGASTARTRLSFESPYLSILRDLRSAFAGLGAVTPEGKALACSWQGASILVANGACSEFTLTYMPDMTLLGRQQGNRWQPFAVFRRKTIFFVAQDVFPTLEAEPASITVRFTLPGRTRVFSNLENKGDGVFSANPDLFGNLRYDFPKAYFAGGEPCFTVTHETAWGDKYIYVWFDRDYADQMWLPSWGTTPWEEAEGYMGLAEQLSGCFREKLGPLPPRTVLFTNSRAIPGLDLREMKTTTTGCRFGPGKARPSS